MVMIEARINGPARVSRRELSAKVCSDLIVRVH